MNEELINIRFTLIDFIILSALLAAGYILLSASDRLMQKSIVPEALQTTLGRWLHKILIAYEPLAAIVLLVVFIFINPVFNGILALLVIVANFIHLKNYLSGRIVRLDNALVSEKRIKSGDVSGTITRLGRLGLQIRTNEGLHHLNYERLLTQGYTMISGEEVGEYCVFTIELNDNEKDGNLVGELEEFISFAPYLSLDYKPEISTGEHEIKLRVLLRKKGHVTQLIQLFTEAGYTCSLNSRN